MTRMITVAGAQLGPIQRTHSRVDVVERMIIMLRQASRHGADLVVFPELALTTFFPRWMMEDQAEVDSFFETMMPSPATEPLLAEARLLKLGLSFGFAELVEEDGHTKRFNTQILFDKAGQEVLRYRKIHLPGHAENEPWRPFQHLEKRYFDVGDLSWPTADTLGGRFGMMICNDRRWPESYRVMGLQGVDMILLGYNTPRVNPPAPEHDRLSEFHNHLVMQAGAYQNAAWLVGVAKCGVEEGCELIGDSVIIAPSGEIVAKATTHEDELILARCDLDAGNSYKSSVFDFARHREPELYGLITARKGAGPPL
ncbi:MAG: N-carbamoyl-D-amino-acid hydrolase [Devosia sp.]